MTIVESSSLTRLNRKSDGDAVIMMFCFCNIAVLDDGQWTATHEQGNDSQMLDKANRSIASSFGMGMSYIGDLYLHFIMLIDTLIMKMKGSCCVQGCKGSIQRACHSRLSYNLCLLRIISKSAIYASPLSNNHSILFKQPLHHQVPASTPQA